MKIAGLDIGTTGCKITVFDENGAKTDSEYRAYPASRLKSTHELDAFALRNSILEVVKAAAERFPDIKGIGVTSFGESFIAAGSDGNPLRPLMLYTDPRGAEECAELVNKLGREKIASITGLNPHSMYSLPKLMWIARNEPEVFAKIKHVFLVEDYAVFLLTGKRAIDYSLATRTMAFDLKTLDWNGEIFEAAGIDPSLFSKPVSTGTAVGKISAEAAAKTGLSRDVLVVAVAHDQVAAAAGAGVTEPGIAAEGAGTVECITPVYKEIPSGTSFQNNNYNVVPYFGSYVAYAFSYTGGALLEWCVDNVCRAEKEEARAAGVSVHEYLQRGYKGPTGILVLPHFAGAATPYMDSGSRGVIAGLDMSTSARDVYFACMEAVAYEMRLNIEKISESGIKINRLVATGGGAKSALWTKIKSDVTGLPIDVLETTEAGTVGSAMLTGVATGVFKSLEEARSKMVVKTAERLPDPRMHERYGEIYERYKKLYGAVRPLV